MTNGGTTIMVQGWLDALNDASTRSAIKARQELLEHSQRRMEAMCRKMFFPSLQGKPVGWDDVYQEAAVRLWKALEDIRPTTVREFFGLATLQIRRVMLDMCRSFQRSPEILTRLSAGDSGADPARLAHWTEFHEAIEKLDPILSETFCLLWYQELTQVEAAELLKVDESTVKRRSRKARELLVKYLPQN